VEEWEGGKPGEDFIFFSSWDKTGTGERGAPGSPITPEVNCEHYLKCTDKKRNQYTEKYFLLKEISRKKVN
jgi:hypothetical protein